MRKGCLLVSLLCSAVVTSAAPVGSIKGYVRDASGGAVTGSSVAVSDELTKVSRKTIADGNGFYQFLDLAPGLYSVSGEAAGFRKGIVRSVSVLLNQVVALDLTLAIGTVNEVVEVVGGVNTLIEPDKVSTGVNFDPTLTARLPLINRRFSDLALLTPGATFAASGTQGSIGFAAAGSRAQSTNWMIDGVNALDPQVNAPTNNFRISDAIQEMSVITSAPSAEFGRLSGAQVNVVTKSGSDQFHGGAFWFNRNDTLQAADFFTNKFGGTKNGLLSKECN